MMNREDKIKAIKKDIHDCEMLDCNESIFTNLNSTDIFKMANWALENAPLSPASQRSLKKRFDL